MGVLINGELLIMLGIPIYLIVAVVNMLRLYKLQRINWIMELVKFTFSIYAILVAAVTLFPISLGIASNYNHYRLPINLIPFKEVVEQIGNVSTSYGGDVAFSIRLILRNVLGNLILLAPLGVILPIIWKRISSVRMAILQGFIVSISIELLQLIEILSGIGFARIVDIDDVILNVLGTVIGYLIYRAIYYVSNRYNIKVMTNIFDS